MSRQGMPVRVELAGPAVITMRRGLCRRTKEGQREPWVRRNVCAFATVASNYIVDSVRQKKKKNPDSSRLNRELIAFIRLPRRTVLIIHQHHETGRLAWVS